MKDRHNKAIHQAQDEILVLQELLDQLSWGQTQKEEELLTIQSRIKFMQQSYNDEKEHMSLTNSAMNDEIEQYERQIQKLKMDIETLLIESQQKAQKATLE